MAQAMHAALAFSYHESARFRRWLSASNYLVVVNVRDESALQDLIDLARQKSIITVPMVEPDLDDQVTAVAFEPGVAARKICAQLPLALRESMSAYPERGTRAPCVCHGGTVLSKSNPSRVRAPSDAHGTRGPDPGGLLRESRSVTTQPATAQKGNGWPS